METGNQKKRGSGKDPLYKSFSYAFAGIFRTIRSERNMKIHCFAACMVVLFGIFLHLSREEWFTCLILFALVMSLELVNTAVEATVDLATKVYDPLGAVLIAAIFAAIIGLWIFVPKLLALL